VRIAFFSPLRPIPSGISDYSEELLPYLARGAEISLFVDDYEPANLALRCQFPIYRVGQYEEVNRRQPFDVNLYHMGNHACHEYMYPMLQRYPGVLVLHDSVLHHFLGYLLEVKGDVVSYLAGFSDQVGPSLLLRRQARIWSNVDHFTFPGIRRVVECSLGILVHNEAARQAVLKVKPDARVQLVRHHWAPLCTPYASMSPEEIKVQLGFRPDTFLIVSPGTVTPARRIPETLRIFNYFIGEYPNSRLVIVGPDNPAVNAQAMIRDMRLQGLVRMTGFVDVPTFQSYILAADVLVNLRYPLAGETSGGLVRAMGMGKPVLVSNVGQYAEFPDDCCLKVDLGESEEEMALAYLDALYRDPELRQQIGEQARRYVQAEASYAGAWPQFQHGRDYG
jgi:glycosyltransferase involved in cell wall biosynthesis